MSAWANTFGSAIARKLFLLLGCLALFGGLPSSAMLTARAAPVPLTLSVNAAADQHPISAYIYGMNDYGTTDSSFQALATTLRLPVFRWGGNTTSRYNWQTDFYNTGSDYYFENIPLANSNRAELPNNSTTDRFVQRGKAVGTASLITIPMLGWVSKSSPLNHPYDCGFKVSKYLAQQSTDQFDTNCGNGIAANGSPIIGNDPLDTSVAVGPDFMRQWVTHLVGRFGTAGSGGVPFYALDNEPGVWSETHRDVFPNRLTYQELLNRTINYASAIRQADPNAAILGPVQDGWTRYFYSAYNTFPDTAAEQDRTANGGQPFVEWYLDRLRAYEQQHGVRLIDYFDLHYYPQATGVALSPAGDAANQALRLRSTRSLWDASYSDESWIATTEGGPAVKLIPRMRAWVAQHYPGQKIAISEYNWGALDHINGALAQADVLGIFGREQVDLATLWSPPNITDPGAFAFRMYRNYDGNGRGFGDLSVRATSTDQDQLAIYAAHRSSDGALTVMVINKTAGALTTPITLSNAIVTGPVARYEYSPANLNAIAALTPVNATSGTINATYPAQSITLFVAPGTPPKLFYLPFIRR